MARGRYQIPKIFEYGREPMQNVSMFNIRTMNPSELMQKLKQAYEADDAPLIVRKQKVIVPSRIGRDAPIDGRVLEPTEVCSGDPLVDTLHLELGNFRFDPQRLNFIFISNDQLYAGEDPTAFDMIKDEHPQPAVIGYIQAGLTGKKTEVLSYFDNSSAYIEFKSKSRSRRRPRYGSFPEDPTAIRDAFVKALAKDQG